jgi:2-oxoglutarate ferredoxin oxidoreductase subunit beta
MVSKSDRPEHPCEAYVHVDVAQPFWCSGCGIGAVVNAFVHAVDSLRMHIVAGHGCAGKVVEYLRFGAPQIASGNVIAYALALRHDHPDDKIVVFMNDVDFLSGDAKKIYKINTKTKTNDILIIYINNYIYYTLVQHKCIANTPFMGKPIDHSEDSPFNMPYLAWHAGARFVARWTQLHIRRFMYSLTEALRLHDFSFIEIIAPCLMFYASNGNTGKKIDRLEYLKSHTVIRNHDVTDELDLRRDDGIIVGTFVSGIQE